MASFEENVNKFSSTIYGSEMKDSLCGCFEFLSDNVDTYGAKIDEIREKLIKFKKEGVAHVDF